MKLRRGYVIVAVSKEIDNAKFWQRIKSNWYLRKNAWKSARRQGGWLLWKYDVSDASTMEIPDEINGLMVETKMFESNIVARRYHMVGINNVDN